MVDDQYYTIPKKKVFEVFYRIKKNYCTCRIDLKYPVNKY